MAKGRDKQGREQRKPKKAKKQAQDITTSVNLRHHSIGPSPAAPAASPAASPRPPEQAEAS